MKRFGPTFLLTLLAISASDPSSNIEIPLLPFFSVRGIPAIEVSLSGREFLLPLYFGRTSTFGRTAQLSDSSTAVNVTMRPSLGGPDAVNLLENEYNLELLGSSTRVARLAIGPGSSFLNNFNSVALIQNATNPVILSLRSLQENFESVCSDEIIVAKIHSSDAVPKFHGELLFGNEPRSMPISPPSLFNEIMLPMDFGYLEAPAVVLGNSLFSAIVTRLRHAGILYRGGFNFDNCTHVPADLELVLYTYPNADGYGMGKIVIEAEDYIMRRPSTNTCTVERSYSPSSFFNPFKIPGLNIRLTRGETEEVPALMQFCDSSL